MNVQERLSSLSDFFEDMTTSDPVEGVSECRGSSPGSEDSDEAHIQGSDEIFRRHLRHTGFLRCISSSCADLSEAQNV
jgi:hypothetical protein